jgi:hypothetical protein
MVCIGAQQEENSCNALGIMIRGLDFDTVFNYHYSYAGMETRLPLADRQNTHCRDDIVETEVFQSSFLFFAPQIAIRSPRPQPLVGPIAAGISTSPLSPLRQ